MLRPILFLSAIIVVGISSCDSKHDEVYEEPVTSALVILTPDTGQVVILQYLDRDGEGGRAPLVSGGTLEPNTTYNCQIQLNTIGKHVVDSTLITNEPEIHQIFFLTQNELRVQTEYTDLDANGFPIGLRFTLRTESESSGQFSVIIKHNPNKLATGVSRGDITSAGGKTDFEATFDISVSPMSNQ